VSSWRYDEVSVLTQPERYSTDPHAICAEADVLSNDAVDLEWDLTRGRSMDALMDTHPAFDQVDRTWTAEVAHIHVHASFILRPTKYVPIPIAMESSEPTQGPVG